jgi:phenylacetic acid degradation operon negative regulatory protein
MKSESTRTLLFGVFVLAGRELTAAQLIALAGPLGVSATNVKSHLTRMVAEGVLKRSGVARQTAYRPSAQQAHLVQGIQSRLSPARAERWDGRWLMLAVRLPANRTERERLRAMLWFDGFRPWTAGSFLRPAWPLRWTEKLARDYAAQAVGLGVCGALVRAIGTSEVASMYQLGDLDREARQLAAWIRRYPVGEISAEKAFAAQLQVGGLVARLVGHDPRLPQALWGRRRGMRELVREFHRFQARTALRARVFLDQVLSA